MRPRSEIEAMLERVDARLEGLRAREAELSGEEGLFAGLQALAARVDFAHVTRQRLQLSQELASTHVEELKRLVADDAAHELMGEAGAARKGLAAELAKAEAAHRTISSKYEGMAGVVEERTRAWSEFRSSHHDSLRAELGEEAGVLRDDLQTWVEQRGPLEQRWRAMDAKWAAVERASYATGSGQGGRLPTFPVKVEGQPVHPIPQSVAPSAGVRAAA
jgi:hypothetical protein